MVQIHPLPVLLSFILLASSFAAPLPAEDISEIDLGTSSNQLVSRKIHIHLPKVHLPHIDGSKVLDGLRKWAPKIGKAVFKIATKLILREEAAAGELEPRYGSAVDLSSILAVSERGINEEEEEGIDELFARAPKKKALKKLLKAAKKMKKYAKKYVKQELKAAVTSSVDNVMEGEPEGDFVKRSPKFDIVFRDEEISEYDLVVKELKDADIEVKELDVYLDVFVRVLEDLTFEPVVERDDWEVWYGR